MARGPDIKTINNTDTIFIYETGLNIPDVHSGIAFPGGDSLPTKLVKFQNDQPATNVSGGGQQLAEIPCDTAGVCSINTAPPYLGIWYPFNASVTDLGTALGVRVGTYIQIQHADVTLDAVLAVDHTSSIAAKSVTRDTKIAFKLISNYAAPYFRITKPTPNLGNATVNIEITTPGGGKIQIFGNNSVDLRTILLNQTAFYTDNRLTAIELAGVEAGTYTATAKWTSDMPWYNLESNSNAVTFTVLSKPITITTNKESVVRGNTFVVTVTGESKKAYWVYLKDSSIGSTFSYPQVAAGQSFVNINFDPNFNATLTDLNPDYIKVTPKDINKTAANITTAADGTRAIQFNTVSTTYDTKYTVKVADPLDLTKYDTVDVTVEKGQVTITYEGTGTYYLGETIKLTGTNTDSDNVYLYLVGPNLATNGVSLTDVGIKSVNDNVATFKQVSVNTDNTWSFKWDTSSLNTSQAMTLDAGTYTVYAAAQPEVKDSLTNIQYSTASVVLKKPFITASASTNTLAAGDILYVRGTAEGKPNNVNVWIFGKNYRSCSNGASVKSDASYEYKLDRGDTTDLYSGQYFVVVQHPMMNGIFDIVGDTSGKTCSLAMNNSGIKTTWTGGAPTVRLVGLQASDAATALVELLNSPNIDDTYTKLSFLVENPQINIDTIGDKYVGDTFKITGTTNLAEGDQILITVTSSSFQPTEKTQTGEFSGASGTVTVQKGDTYNTWSFDVDASTFKPDEYLVKAESIQPTQTTTATFNVLEAAPTMVPITAVTTPVVTAAATTAAPTTVATAVATTVKPQPGFGALVALVGLGAVALLVLRRR
jgi:PGF-CTERM protein